MWRFTELEKGGVLMEIETRDFIIIVSVKSTKLSSSCHSFHGKRLSSRIWAKVCWVSLYHSVRCSNLATAYLVYNSQAGSCKHMSFLPIFAYSIYSFMLPMSVCLYICVYTTCMLGTHGGQKRVSSGTDDDGWL